MNGSAWYATAIIDILACREASLHLASGGEPEKYCSQKELVNEMLLQKWESWPIGAEIDTDQLILEARVKL